MNALKIFTVPVLLIGIATPTQAFNLTPSSTIGNVRSYDGENSLYISSGSKSRVASSLAAWLRQPVGDYGKSGSGALFTIAPGTYDLTWKMYTARDEDSDWLVLFDGSNFNRIARSAIATIAKEYERPEDFDRWRTNSISTRFNTTTGTFALLSMDTNRRWDTTWKLENIAAVPSVGVPEPTTIGGLAIGGFLAFRRKLGSKA
jgi:hypothetical protein